MFIATLILGIIGIFLWIYVIYNFIYHKIRVDRILSRGKLRHLALVISLIALLPFSISFVAWINDVQPYDLLYNGSLFGRGSDLEAKLLYRQNLEDKINEVSEDPSLVSTVFYHFRGLGSEFAAGTPKGRIWAFFIGMIGVLVMCVVLVPAVLRFVTLRTENYRQGRQRYNIEKSPYAVIFGAHETVPDLIKKILSDKHKQRIKYVIVHTSESITTYRPEIESRLSHKEEKGLILYNGNRTTSAEIAALHLERAKEVYVLGEMSNRETESDHDSMNMECVRIIAQNLRDRNRLDRLQCYVLFDFQTTFTAFLYSDLSKVVKEQMEFIYINYYELWAQNVLSRPQTTDPNKIKYLPLEGDVKMDKDCDKHVHLVIVGMSKMGVALALEAAHVAHYPNFCSKQIRTKITFIDPDVETEMRYFVGRYSDMFEICRWRQLDIEQPGALDTPWNDTLNEMAEMKRDGKTIPFDKYPYSHLADEKKIDCNFLDIEWEFMKGTIETQQTKRYLESLATDESEILTVAICRSKSPQAIASGIYLPREVYRNAVQILVYQNQSADIINNISGMGLQRDNQSKMRYNKLRPFGMLSECFSNNIVDNRLAKLVNYVYNRQEDVVLGNVDDSNNKENLPNQEVFWRNCSVSDQWSSVYNANSITTKLRFLGLDFRNSSIEDMRKVFETKESLDILSEVEHNRWNTEKLLMGYRPLNDKEIVPFIEMLKNKVSLAEYYTLKKELKTGWDMAHLNICSFDQLKVYDNPSIEYDVIMTKAFPAIVEKMRSEVE